MGSCMSWGCCRAEGRWRWPSAQSVQGLLWPVHDTSRRMWGSRDTSRPGSGAHKTARPSYCSQSEEAFPFRGWGAAQPPVWPRVLCAARGEDPAFFCFPIADAQPQYSHGSSVNHARLRCPAVSLCLYWKSHRLTERGHFDDL